MTVSKSEENIQEHRYVEIFLTRALHVISDVFLIDTFMEEPMEVYEIIREWREEPKARAWVSSTENGNLGRNSPKT